MSSGSLGADDALPVLRDAGEHDIDVYVLGVRQSVDDDESLAPLFMECYDAEAQQEIDLGMDTYCLVVDPGQATAYGGVLECEVTDRHLRLVLTEETADELGLPARLEFALELAEEQLAMVRRGLLEGPDLRSARRCAVASGGVTAGQGRGHLAYRQINLQGL